MPNVNQLSKIQHVILFSCIFGMNTISMNTIDILNTISINNISYYIHEMVLNKNCLKISVFCHVDDHLIRNGIGHFDLSHCHRLMGGMSHCEKYHNFPTRKLGEITIFFAVSKYQTKNTNVI